MATRSNDGRVPPYDVPDSHLVNRAAVADEAVFAEEKRKILDRVWRLACHESADRFSKSVDEQTKRKEQEILEV